MSRSAVAYKYYFHVPGIKDTLIQTYTQLRTSSRQASITAAKASCNKPILQLQTNLTVQQTLSATHHKNLKPLFPSCTPIPTLQTSITESHHISASHLGPSSHLPLPQRRKQEGYSIRKVARGMNITPEQKNPKRQREPDSTLSPPPKKAHNKTSPRSEGSCVDELISPKATTVTASLPYSENQPDTTRDTDTSLGEGVAVKEEFIPKGRTDIQPEEGTASERLIPDEQMMTSINPEGDTDLKLVTEGGTHKNELASEGGTTDTKPMCDDGTIKDFALEEKTDMDVSLKGNKDKEFTPKEGTTDTKPMCDKGTIKDFAPEEKTDMDVSPKGKTDKEFTPKEGTSKMESGNLQVDINPQMTMSDPTLETNIYPSAESHSTTSDTMALNLPSLRSFKREESISSTTGPPEDAKGISSTDEGGREHQGKKKKKHSSQKSKKRKLSGENKNLRPNYFVGIQVSNPAIHRALLKVQEDLVAWDESLVKALVDVATSHLTLLVAHLDTEESIAVASAALEESAARLRDGISASPITLTFTGVSNFSNQVVFAQVVEDSQHQRLLDVAECVRRVFEERGVCMPDTRDLHPHLTIAKLSKTPRTKGKHPVLRKIDPSCYRQHFDLHLGSQTVAGLQLLSMNKAKDDHRYYHSDKQVFFDIKMAEEKDHSGCCFPRRPTLPLPLHRTYSTTTTATTTTAATTTSEDVREDAPTWLLPVAGVTTLVAGALLLGFALARLRGNQ